MLPLLPVALGLARSATGLHARAALARLAAAAQVRVDDMALTLAVSFEDIASRLRDEHYPVKSPRRVREYSEYPL